MRDKSVRKKIFLGIAVLVLVVLVGAGGWWLLRQNRIKNSLSGTVASQTQTNDKTQTNGQTQNAPQQADVRTLIKEDEISKIMGSDIKEVTNPAGTGSSGKADSLTPRFYQSSGAGNPQLATRITVTSAKLTDASVNKGFEDITKTASDAQIVEGVGERAVWSNQYKSLMVQSKNYIVTVGVTVAGQADKDKSIAIVNIILPRLKSS